MRGRDTQQKPLRQHLGPAFCSFENKYVIAISDLDNMTLRPLLTLRRLESPSHLWTGGRPCDGFISRAAANYRE